MPAITNPKFRTQPSPRSLLIVLSESQGPVMEQYLKNIFYVLIFTLSGSRALHKVEGYTQNGGDE